MTDRGKLKEEVKKQVRSILLSWPRGLTVKEMFQDYKSFMGNELPFRRLGYSTAEQFFSDIRDVVHMSWQRGEMFLRGVSDESTRHIEELVARQKPPKRSKARGTKRPPQNFMRHRSFQPPRPNPTVPAFVREQIKTFMFSYSNGILSSHFETTYEKRFNASLRYKQLGFRCLLDLLAAIPDIVKISEHANGFMIIPVKQNSFTIRKPEQNVKFNVPPIVNSNEDSTKEDFAEEFPVEPSPRKAEADSYEEEKEEDSEPDIFEDDHSGIAKKLQIDIRKVLSRKPDGVWASVFQFEFKEVIGYPLPIKELGYLSVISLMDVLPHLVSIERPTSRDWLLFDARLKSNEGADKGGSPLNKGRQHHIPTSTAPSIDTCIRESIRQVVAAYPDGLPMRQLPTAYKALTGKELPLKRLGYATLEVMLMQLTDAVVMDYAGPNQILLHVIETSTLGTNLLIQQPHTERRGIPVDAVGPGISYLAIMHPTDFTDFIEVYVSYVNNPGDFYLQMKGLSTTVALEEVMDRLEDAYYCGSSNDYMLPESMITIGQVCAAIFPEDDNWHRTTVTGIKDSNYVEVFFVDYGGICCVHKSNLRLLKNRFLKLPAQACKARLANVRPAHGDTWPPAAKTRVLSLCAGKALVCLITDISNEMVWSTCLCDTSNPNEDVHVNDTLILDGFAKLHADHVQADYVQADHVETRSISKIDESVPTGDRSSPDGSACETGEVKIPRHVRFIQLTDEHNCYLIKYEEKPYVVSGDVSALIWGNDQLRSMLRKKKLNIPKVIVSIDDQPEIFEDISRYEVLGTREKEGLKSHITLYSLESVIQILEVFNHPCQELHQCVREQIELFDPEDIYWKGDDPKSISDQSGADNDSSVSDDTEESEEDSDDEEIDIKMLEQALQILQIRRKKILQTLMSVSTSEQTTQPVDELDVVEKQIMDIKKRIRLQNGETEMDQCEGNNPMVQALQSETQAEETISAASPTDIHESSKSVKVEQLKASQPDVANSLSLKGPNLNAMFSNLSVKPRAPVAKKQPVYSETVSRFSQPPPTANVAPQFIPQQIQYQNPLSTLQQMPYQETVYTPQQMPFQNPMSGTPNYLLQQFPYQSPLNLTTMAQQIHVPQLQDPMLSQAQSNLPCDMRGQPATMNQAQFMYSNPPQQGMNWMGLEAPPMLYQGMAHYGAPPNTYQGPGNQYQGPVRPITKRYP